MDDDQMPAGTVLAAQQWRENDELEN